MLKPIRQNKLYHFLSVHRKLILFVGVFLLLGGALWIAGTSPALAAAPNPAKECTFIGDTACFLVNFLSSILLAIARLFLAITLFLLTFIIQIAGYNGYLSSTAVTVGWVMVRDITNMLFVIILLIIAFGTILGLEQYEWKKLLVKFVLAAILVNFSRIICGVFIDLAQVVMSTFVNGIAASAGGNLIKAFSLDGLRDINPETGAGQLTYQNTFLASIGAVFFSAIVMAVMGAFMMMLVARMVVLWVLIVLSPLAFVLSVVPNTQKYATQWWGEFGSNLVTGPVLLFFVWLSFVTVGGGDINTEIEISAKKNVPTVVSSSGVEAASNQSSHSAGISKSMTWPAMANFAIAVAMLMVGAKAASQMGGIGASWAQGAVDFGKKVATVATGLAAAKWVGRQGLQAAAGAGKAVGKFALMNAPVVGGKAWQRRGRDIKSKATARFYDWQAGKTRQASDIAKVLKVNEKGQYVDDKGKVQTGAGAWLKRQVARGRLATGVGYGGFKEAVSEDLEETAKNKKEAIEHLASTSSLALGQEKKKSREYLESLKTSGQDIKAGRMAGAMERRSEIDQIVNAGEKDKDKKLTPAGLADISSKLRERGLNDREIEESISLAERKGKGSKEKAVEENIGETLNLKKQENVLRARANDYRKRGDFNRADIQERKADNLVFDKLKEGMKGRRGAELLAFIEATASEVAAARKDNNPEKLRQKQQELFVANNMARGHEEAWVARAADRSVLKGAGVDVTGLTDQEVELSIDLAGNVRDLGLDVTKAADEITGFLGGDKKAQAALRERSIVNEKNVVMGIAERSDIIAEQVTPEGRTEYKVSKAALAEPAAARPQMQNYKQLISLNTAIHAPVSVKNRDIASGHIKNVTSEELGIIADKLKNITTKVGIDKINDRFVDDLNSATLTTAGAKKAVDDFYKRLEKEMDKQAFEAFQGRTNKLYDQRK